MAVGMGFTCRLVQDASCPIIVASVPRPPELLESLVVQLLVICVRVRIIQYIRYRFNLVRNHIQWWG